MTVLPIIVENTMKHQKIPNFDDIVDKHLSFGIAGRDIKNDKVILERNLELSNEMKDDMIYGLRIYPIKNVTGVCKGYIVSISVLALLQVLLPWFLCWYFIF